jgi:hypothetical protein
MDKKMRTLTILVTIVSVSAVLLGAALTAGLSYYNSGDVFKQAACLGKVLGFGEKGIIRAAGGLSWGHIRVFADGMVWFDISIGLVDFIYQLSILALPAVSVLKRCVAVQLLFSPFP